MISRFVFTDQIWKIVNMTEILYPQTSYRSLAVWLKSQQARIELNWVPMLLKYCNHRPNIDVEITDETNLTRVICHWNTVITNLIKRLRWEFIQENKKVKKKENTLSTKKVRFKKNDNDQDKEERKWKTQIRIKHSASFFIYIQFGRIEKWHKLL